MIDSNELEITGSDFVDQLEGLYKPYKKNPAMKKIIVDTVNHMASDNLRKLLKIILDNYNGSRYGPPDIHQIREMAGHSGVQIAVINSKTTQWCCGQCGEEYDYELTHCPNPDCRKPTRALPVRCVCGKFFPDDFVCCTKTENGLTMKIRIEGVRNDKREQNVRCNECGKSWKYFDITSDPYIYSGRCKGPGCGKPREAGRVIRRG